MGLEFENLLVDSDEKPMGELIIETARFVQCPLGLGQIQSMGNPRDFIIQHFTPAVPRHVAALFRLMLCCHGQVC